MATRILLAALPLALAQPAAAQAAKPKFIAVELIAESTTPRPGGAMLVGLRMVPRPGWHSYWSNPGEAGFPTVVEWSAPEGVKFGPLRHPAPSTLETAGMTSFVHEGPHILTARMTLDREVAAGTPLPVTAEVSWAACSDALCVPERATLKLELAAGNGAASPQAAMLRKAVGRQPRPARAGAFDASDGMLVIQLPAAMRLDPDGARFFPDETVIDPTSARVVSARPLRIAAPLAGPVPRSLSGVVGDGNAAYRLRFERKPLGSGAPEPARTESAPARERVPPQSPRAVAAEESVAAAVPAPPPTLARGPAGWPKIAGAIFLAALGIFLFQRRRRARPGAR